jgi:hypothetical protein
MKCLHKTYNNAWALDLTKSFLETDGRCWCVWWCRLVLTSGTLQVWIGLLNKVMMIFTLDLNYYTLHILNKQKWNYRYMYLK